LALQSSPAPQLKRELGVVGASIMGLGSIVGTGVFVSIGTAAGVAGPSVVLAILSLGSRSPMVTPPKRCGSV
jgi:L-asparagine transporter-like permease